MCLHMDPSIISLQFPFNLSGPVRDLTMSHVPWIYNKDQRDYLHLPILLFHYKDPFLVPPDLDWNH